MAKITYEAVCRSYGNSLRMDAPSPSGREISGWYMGSHVTIRIHSSLFMAERRPEICLSLTCQYEGEHFQRNYNDNFSDHGLKKICARFQRDILFNGVKRK